MSRHQASGLSEPARLSYFWTTVRILLLFVTLIKSLPRLSPSFIKPSTSDNAGLLIRHAMSPVAPMLAIQKATAHRAVRGSCGEAGSMYPECGKMTCGRCIRRYAVDSKSVSLDTRRCADSGTWRTLPCRYAVLHADNGTQCRYSFPHADALPHGALAKSRPCVQPIGRVCPVFARWRAAARGYPRCLILCPPRRSRRCAYPLSLRQLSGKCATLPLSTRTVRTLVNDGVYARLAHTTRLARHEPGCMRVTQCPPHIATVHRSSGLKMRRTPAQAISQADVIDRIAPIMLRITRRLVSFALRPGVHAMDATSWYIVEHDGNPPSVRMRRR